MWYVNNALGIILDLGNCDLIRKFSSGGRVEDFIIRCTISGKHEYIYFEDSRDRDEVFDQICEMLTD